jgi:hypothetical protein
MKSLACYQGAADDWPVSTVRCSAVIGPESGVDLTHRGHRETDAIDQIADFETIKLHRSASIVMQIERALADPTMQAFNQ